MRDEALRLQFLAGPLKVMRAIAATLDAKDVSLVQERVDERRGRRQASSQQFWSDQDAHIGGHRDPPRPKR